VIGGGTGNGQAASGGSMSGNVMEALLAMLLNDKISSELGAGAAPLPRNPSADALRSRIQKDLDATKG